MPLLSYGNTGYPQIRSPYLGTNTLNMEYLNQLNDQTNVFNDEVDPVSGYSVGDRLTGLASRYSGGVPGAPTTENSTSWLDSFIGKRGTGVDGAGGTGVLGTLSDSNFMKGALGLGQLGLGLASYVQQKPLLEEQLKGARMQNQEFARQAGINKTATNAWNDAEKRVYGQEA